MRRRSKQLGLLILISALVCVWLWGHQTDVSELSIHKSSWFDLQREEHCYVNLLHKCGYRNITQQRCENIGCCWVDTKKKFQCFKKFSPHMKYFVKDVKISERKISLILQHNSLFERSYSKCGKIISPLVVDILAETSQRLHIKIYDLDNSRWEIPTRFFPPQKSYVYPQPSLYEFTFSQKSEKFHFAIKRKSNEEVIFDTTGLTFTDKYLSIGTRLPKDHYLYGLGERATPYFRLQPRTYTMWAYDAPTPQYSNLYGSHPFYLDLRENGSAHGVFLKSSNGMDVVLGRKSLTYNVIGGVLDFYFFLGPEPEAVIQQYQEVIGRPKMPPYWALGFHQCRYGYPNLDKVEEVVRKFAIYKIPLDTIWTDIDYMDHNKSFTFDPQKFPVARVKSFVQSLHTNGQQYMVIVDPGIKVESGYSAYDDGLKMDIFIKNKKSQVFTGKVWPGIVAFPDFIHPRAYSYWLKQITHFYDVVPVDGLWIDMNEISNFCNGECSSLAKPQPTLNLAPTVDNEIQISKSVENRVVNKGRPQTRRLHSVSEKQKLTESNKVTRPCYAIDNQGLKVDLNSRTIDINAVHYDGILEYDAHNLYGFLETIVTNKALEEIRLLRSLVISRSTFPGTGVHGGHWTGDNHATWMDLSQSIPGVLNFQLFGIPMTGADICGFLGNTTEELCGRWMQLGAFYPFSRNHNSKYSNDQEPYLWPSVAKSSRIALSIRYRLLPYYYTLFYKAHRQPAHHQRPSATVLRPLFFEFPHEIETYQISKQFLVGNGLMISPVLQKGSRSVEVYFPSGKWYDFYTFEVISLNGKETKTLSTPLNHIQIHLYGGSIIPMQDEALTTKKSRKMPFSLLVVLDKEGKSSGDLFWDDGESIMITSYIFVYFVASENKLIATVTGPGYHDTIPSLSTITILGVAGHPTKALLCNQYIPGFSFNSSTQSLKLSNLRVPLNRNFDIEWI